MSRLQAGALVVAASVLTLVPPPAPGAGQGYVVVVNQANPVHHVSRADLSKVFLKRSTAWPGGAAAVPFDLSGTSPVRKAFSQAVHGKPLWVVVAYWQQEVASGRTRPPAVCPTEEAALEAVSTTPGGVAYVSEGAALTPGVKLLTLDP
jgi:ABC-type phosphate transport system substrate-binding protein